MNIGFFDSGIGGISIAKEVIKALPQYSYVYYADDLHMPYGSKHAQTLFELTTRALGILFTHYHCTLVILACNTATTVLPRIQQEWLPIHFPDCKVLGVIRPTVEYMTEVQSNNPVYLLATAQTVRAKSYDHELAKIGKQCDFHEIPCPLLAQAIEDSESIGIDEYILSLLERYLQPVPKDTPVTIYTGCTHYAFVVNIIRSIINKSNIITQDVIVAEKLSYFLQSKPNLTKKLANGQNSKINMMCSSMSMAYLKKLHTIFGY